jgi:hypothetical protein
MVGNLTQLFDKMNISNMENQQTSNNSKFKAINRISEDHRVNLTITKDNGLPSFAIFVGYRDRHMRIVAGANKLDLYAKRTASTGHSHVFNKTTVGETDQGTLSHSRRLM